MKKYSRIPCLSFGTVGPNERPGILIAKWCRSNKGISENCRAVRTPDFVNILIHARYRTCQYFCVRRNNKIGPKASLHRKIYKVVGMRLNAMSSFQLHLETAIDIPNQKDYDRIDKSQCFFRVQNKSFAFLQQQDELHGFHSVFFRILIIHVGRNGVNAETA